MSLHARRLIRTAAAVLLAPLVLLGVLLAVPGVAHADGDEDAAWEPHRAELEDLLTTIRFDFGGVAERLGLPVGELLGPFDLQRMVEATAERAEERERAPRFAEVDGLELRTPSHEVVLVGFHQSWDPAAHEMDAIEDVPMMTLHSRGRGTPRRSAADISVREGEEVLAPVSGEVLEVAHYALYGRYPDVRIRIAPDEHPDLVVTVLHVSDPGVAVGDTVAAGETALAATATTFPFTSQIDRFVGRLPHVHIEVTSR